MRLGDVANEDAAKYGKPLDGVRVLALEQMQALPYATQLLARLGADVVKVEAPAGESGRGSQPGMHDPEGRFIGATFLRNNLSKRSVTVNLKADAGRELVLALAPHFDVFAENFKSGALDRMGLGYDDVAAVHPSVIYASVSGFGASGSPYADWPAYASIAESMSGIYDYVLVGDEVPRPNPVGALGDISSALFATIGILAALRHRDATGEGQRVDIAMYDSTVAMTDIVTNFESLGKHRLNEPKNAILDPFRAADGWFVMQLVREHQLERISPARRSPGVARGPAPRDARGLGGPPRGHAAARHRGVGVGHDEDGGGREAVGRGHRVGAGADGVGGRGRPPPRSTATCWSRWSAATAASGRC